MNSRLCTINLDNNINFDMYSKILLNKADIFYILDESGVNDGTLYSILYILKENNKKYCIRSKNLDVITDCRPDAIRVSNNWDNSDGIIDSIIEFGQENNIPTIFEVHSFSNNCLLGSLEWYSLYPELTYEVFIQEFSFKEIDNVLKNKDNIFNNKNVYFRDIPICFAYKYNLKRSNYLPDYIFSTKGLFKTYAITFANDFFKVNTCRSCSSFPYCNGIRRESKDLSKYVESTPLKLNLTQIDLNEKLMMEN